MAQLEDECTVNVLYICKGRNYLSRLTLLCNPDMFRIRSCPQCREPLSSRHIKKMRFHQQSQVTEEAKNVIKESLRTRLEQEIPSGILKPDKPSGCFCESEHDKLM